MRAVRFMLVICLAGIGARALAAAPPLPPPVLDVAGDIAFVPLLAQGFVKLPLPDKLQAYERVQAALAEQQRRDEQRGPHFALMRQALEGLVTHLPASMPERERRLYTTYLKRFYAHRGNHDRRTGRKLVPGFSSEKLALACVKARRLGARFPGVTTAAGLAALLDELQRLLFDPQYEPDSVIHGPRTRRRTSTGTSTSTSTSTTEPGPVDMQGVTVLAAESRAGPFLSGARAAVDRALLRRVAAEFSCPGEAPRDGRSRAQMFAAMWQVPAAEQGRALRDYRGTIGEARADATVLSRALDPELGRSYLREALLGLRLAPQGEIDIIEGDRDRGRQLVVQYLLRRAKVVLLAGPRGHRVYCAKDPAALRRASGELAGELARIEDAGDYRAALDLVETYGRLIDRGLRDEVLARTAKLPRYVALVAPNLVPVRDGAGQIIDVLVEYPRDSLRQQIQQR